MPQVAVSILNYNSAQSTIACVQSLLSFDQAEGGAQLLEVFVADNASAESDRHHLQKTLVELPNVHVQKNAENMGFSAGHNRNLTAIFNHFNPDYVWVLNSDCLVYEDTLTALIKCALQHVDVGIWGATLLESDGETIQCGGGCFYNSWISSFRQHGRGKALSQIHQLKSADFDYIAGASLFFPVETLRTGLRSAPQISGKSTIDHQQWLNEVFFLYYEELDLAQRLKPGLGMAWCKDALIRHAGGVSTGASNRRRTAKAEYYSTLSALNYTQLYYPRQLWVMAPARYLAKFLQLFMKGEFRLLGSLTRAYRDFWSA